MSELFCECGKSFDHKGSFRSHQNWCDSSDREAPNIEYEKVECPDCGDMVAETQLGKHKGSKSCKRGGTYETSYVEPRIAKEENKVGDDEYKCPECEKTYSKRGIGTHYWRNHTEEGKNHDPNEGYKKKDREAWNKGLTKEDSESLKKMANSLSETWKNKEEHGGWNHFKETREKLSKIRSQHNPGGWCDWHEYEKKNGEVVKLQGKWEVKCAEILENKDIDWIKPTNGDHFLNYEDDEEITRKYVPDFYLPKNGLYLGVKGHWWANSKQKMEWIQSQNKDKNIRILKAENKEEFVEKTKKLL